MKRVKRYSDDKSKWIRYSKLASNIKGDVFSNIFLLLQQIVNGRDSSNPTYDQTLAIQWGNFNNWLPKFICK